MKVFISSLIAGAEDIREAARSAVTTLRFAPVMAEDFGAQPNSPQVACLAALRQSDLVVLILGEHYGAEQPSGLSATHEEYREARGQKPVIAFVQEGVTPDSRQAEFIREVQGWAGGLLRGGFSSAGELQLSIIRALHDVTLANAVGPVDEGQLVQRAVDGLPDDRREMFGGVPTLNVAVAGGPTQQILRPAEMEDTGLWDGLHQAALFGPTRVLDQSKGVEKRLNRGKFELSQERGGLVRLDEQGGLQVRSSVVGGTGHDRGFGGLAAIIDEDVQHAMTASLALAAAVLDRIDATQRITHVAIATTLTGGDGMGWRTRAEHDASPNSMTIGYGGEDRPAVHVVRPRAALRLDVLRLVEDLVFPLRRQWRQ